MTEEILAPLPGKIVKLNMVSGNKIEVDDEIIVIEAMKMETPIYSPYTGKITTLNVHEGDEVDQDDLIAVVEHA
jgi:biotin carboxyl carrier protein